jgi:hypothetical protein
VLVGSSGLFGFETQVPALMEDIDVAVPETSMRHQVEVGLGRLSALPERLDATLVRLWPGPTRLLACLVDELPPAREVQGGYRVVTRERLGQELVGTVGPRADLFVLYEKVEGIEAS